MYRIGWPSFFRVFSTKSSPDRPFSILSASAAESCAKLPLSAIICWPFCAFPVAKTWSTGFLLVHSRCLWQCQVRMLEHFTPRLPAITKYYAIPSVNCRRSLWAELVKQWSCLSIIACTNTSSSGQIVRQKHRTNTGANYGRWLCDSVYLIRLFRGALGGSFYNIQFVGLAK